LPHPPPWPRPRAPADPACMPNDPPRLLPLLRPPALAMAAGVSLALAAGLMLPELVHCKFASEDNACHATHWPGLRAWLAVALMLYATWLAAVLTNPWLPRAPRWRGWG